MKRAYIRDEIAVIVEEYQKRLGLKNFSDAVNSLLYVNSNSQQPSNQQPAKSSAIDDLDGLF